MSKVTWGYIAGFLDADGYVKFDKDGGVQIHFVNSNREVLESIQNFLGTGRIYPKHEPGSIATFKEAHPRSHVRKKVTYDLHVSTLHEVLRIAKKLQRYSIIKKPLLKKAILHIEEKFKEAEKAKRQRKKETQKALELYNQGLSIAEISRRLKIPYYTLRFRLQREKGYKPRSRSDVLRLAWRFRRGIWRGEPCPT